MKTEIHGGPVVIERTHPSQTEAGLAVLNHLANQPDGCGFDELYAVFLQSKGDPLQAFGTNEKNLRAMLSHMHACGYVETSGRNGARLYRLGDLGKLPSTAKTGAAIKAGKSQAASQRKAAASAGLRTPAPQYDVMHGAVYAPPRSAALRAGCQDFKACPSVGYGC